MSQLNILVDASGSMAEDAKNNVVSYLLSCVRGATQRNAQDTVLNVHQWGTDTGSLDLSQKFKITYGGAPNADALEQIARAAEPGAPWLLISDGMFNRDIQKKLKELFPNLIAVSVGADADTYVLKRLCDRPAYGAADIMTALSELWQTCS